MRRTTTAVVICLGCVALCAACFLLSDVVGSAHGPIISQGVKTIGADVWHAAGYDGTGVKVAVWDFSFCGYERLLGAELPPADRVVAKGFGLPVTGFPDEDPEDAAHGTAVAEIVHDVAPGATLYLIATDTDDDALAALDWMIDQSIDIVVASISVDGWCLDTGSSIYEPMFERLRAAGILLVSSSGNEGLSHWQGPFVDVDGDGLHEFAPSDEGISVRLYAGELIDVILQWDDPCRPSRNDYILRLVDRRGRVVAESDYDNWLDGPYEDLYTEAPRGGTYTIQIEKYSGSSNVVFDLVWPNGPELEHGSREGSVGFFEPSVSPNVLTVGAINWRTLKLESTSSGGPTKDGRIKPDLVAPTCVVTETYGGRASEYREYECGFEGTSAAAPHVAGAAALVKQAFPLYRADEIQAYLEAHAVDQGVPGKDNVYGAGRVLLPPPP